LAMAAAANPLLALEYLGYQLTEKAIQEIGPYARFGPDGLARLADLEQQWTAQTGSRPLPLGKESARDFLLQLTAADSGYKKTASSSPRQTPDLKQLDTALDLVFSKNNVDAAAEKKIADSLSKVHPALPIVRAYHKIHQQRPAFASKEQFQKIISGKTKSVATSIEFRLKDRKANKPDQAV
jgi:hypothetical protein